MKYISNNQIDNLLENYEQAGGEIIQLEEGSLGYGLIALVNNGLNLKQFIIEERFENEWSSEHVLYTYAKRNIAKRYLKLIEQYYDAK